MSSNRTKLPFWWVRCGWILATAYAGPQRNAVRPSFIPTLPGFRRIPVTGAVGLRSSAGPPGPGRWSSHLSLPEGRPLPPGQAWGGGPGTQLGARAARTWRGARVAAGAAAARAGGRGWSRGARRGAWAARARRAAARTAASALATCRPRPSGRCCSGTAPSSSRPRTGTRTPARSPGISSPRGGGAPRGRLADAVAAATASARGAPGMPGPDCSRARSPRPLAGGRPGRRARRCSGPGGDRPGCAGAGSAAPLGHAHAHRAPPARQSVRPRRVCGDSPLAGREPLLCDSSRPSPKGYNRPCGPRAQPLGPRAPRPALAMETPSHPFENLKPPGPRIGVWTSFLPSLYFLGPANA